MSAYDLQYMTHREPILSFPCPLSNTLLDYSALVQSLINNLNSPTPLENNRSSQASNLVIILGVHIRQNSVLSGRNLLWQLHVLCQLHRSLFQRTLEIHVLDVLAQIRFLVDDADQAVLDLQVDFGACFDVFGEEAAGFDREGVAAVSQKISLFSRNFDRVTRGSSWERQRRQNAGLGHDTTHAVGGLGDKSTLSISRIGLSGLAQ